jgi:hypothetical protein
LDRVFEFFGLVDWSRFRVSWVVEPERDRAAADLRIAFLVLIDDDVKIALRGDPPS